MCKHKLYKKNKTAEQGRIEFLDNLKLFYEHLKKDNNLSRSLALLSLDRHRFNNGVLKDCRLVYVREIAFFQDTRTQLA